MHSTRNSITIGIVTLLLGGMVSLGNAQDMGSERELCLQDCRQWIGDYSGFGGRSRGIGDAQARLYARCVERCERKFWKEFDEEFREQ
jgi:hypothetical protein